MCLEMGGVDHQSVRLARFGHQGHEDAFENANVAPAHKAIVERFVGAIAARCVTPLQAVATDVDDAADNPPVIYARQPA